MRRADYTTGFTLDISGSITALATPFAADGSLDLDAFGRLLDQQLAGGTQAWPVPRANRISSNTTNTSACSRSR
jgi:hypothetical protein